jgi:predicted RNA-binding Zn ribbon-like protein
VKVSTEASWKFDLCGGHPAIDFANTVSNRDDHPIERLSSYPALIDFADQSGLLAPELSARLRGWARAEPDAAARLLAEIVELREALYRLFTAVAGRVPPAPGDLAVLNRWWHALELDAGFSWAWAAGSSSPDVVLAPVIAAAVELLTSPRRERISICEAEDCVWLFLDTSKNHSRRWCDMNQCGNRVKARRFYARRTEPPPGG